MLDLAAVLLRARALACVGLVGDDDLVHQRFVVFAAEQRFRRRRRTSASTLGIEQFEFHTLSIACALPAPLTAGRTITSPPFGTRHGAADQQQLALGVDARNDEVLRGALLVAQVARHALARQHAARILAHADRARRVGANRVAVGGAIRGEVVALDRAGKAFADRHARHVDLLADL